MSSVENHADRAMLSLLRCPVCRDHFSEGNQNLECVNQHSFPFDRGVPVFVRDSDQDARQRQTTAVFSEQWRSFGEVTADEQAFSISRKWFLDRYGWKGEDDFEAFLLTRKHILDAGSASGRYANYIALRTPARVYGADIGEGAYLSHQKFGTQSNLMFVQASVTALPFPEASFDFILCDGVLHHTSNPRQAFIRLTQHLAPGGVLAFYVYHEGGPAREWTDTFFNEALSTRSLDDCMRVASEMTAIAEELYEAEVSVTIKSDLSRLGLPAGIYSLHELIYWHFLKLYWDPNVSFEKNVSTNFGWFSPINSYRFSLDAIEEWVSEAGLFIEHCDSGPRGISVRARRD